MLNKILKGVAAAAHSAAIATAGAASLFGMYQPKEPKSLQETKK